MRWHSPLLVTWLTVLVLGTIRSAAVDLEDAAAARDATEGRRTVANAAWWGFDPADSTDALQAAIRSRARTVIVPDTGRPWVIRPIELRDHLELVFEPGVVVLAKAGEFRGGGDSLFRAQDRTRITVRGHGAVLRMRKADYQKPPYGRAEWRMGLSFNGCRDVLVEGLRIESSGGDGIYIGSSPSNRWCENVTIRDCVCHDHHRQGLSVISAVRLRIEHCVFSGTAGTPPEAGIDLEPDLPDERLQDCVIRNCRVTDNRGNGILVYLKPLTRASAPVSIRFEDCVARMGPPGGRDADLAALDREGVSGIAVGWVGDAGPQGLIEFIRCRSENTGRESVRIADKSADGAKVRFVDCAWTNSWAARHREYAGPRAPILIENREPGFCARPGGIEWLGCTVVDRIDGPTVRFEDAACERSLREVRGVLRVRNPWRLAAHLGREPIDVDLRLVPVDGP